jgi:cyclic pyranopterin phosphate synthase
MTSDQFGRRIHYLRISLTDMCNLRCVYCMPENMTFRPAPELMQTAEVTRLVDLFGVLGFTKIRLTGGEPTLREDLVPIIRHIRNTPGVETVAMTTNGIQLRELAAPLADAGLDRVNVSIDTLDPDRFRQMTRWGRVEDVRAGIREAEAKGIEIKLNVVVVRGFNDTKDVLELAGLSRTHPWQIRFIELMPFGSVATFQKEHTVSEKELRTTIESSLGPLALQDEGRLDGEARIFRLNDAPGTIGFISSVTAPFCAGCTRVRLTPDGKLRLCLLRDNEFDLLSMMREGAADSEVLDAAARAIYRKPWGHGLAQNLYPKQRVMSEIGG